MDKRTFLKTSALVGAGGLLSIKNLSASPIISNPFSDIDKIIDETGRYFLNPLPYAFDALEPHIDHMTLVIHHGKHHAGYVNGLNAATDKINELLVTENFADIKYWEKQLAFNGAGHFLHTMYWNSMSPTRTKPSATLEKYINSSFGSFDKFLKYFKAATLQVEASGWGILAFQPLANKLVVLQAAKHPDLSQWMSIPILVCDVWEHAYYLRYQSKRAEYIDHFIETINWEMVSNRLELLLDKKK